VPRMGYVDAGVVVFDPVLQQLGLPREPEFFQERSPNDQSVMEMKVQ